MILSCISLQNIKYDNPVFRNATKPYTSPCCVIWIKHYFVLFILLYCWVLPSATALQSLFCFWCVIIILILLTQITPFDRISPSKPLEHHTLALRFQKEGSACNGSVWLLLKILTGLQNITDKLQSYLTKEKKWWKLKWNGDMYNILEIPVFSPEYQWWIILPVANSGYGIQRDSSCPSAVNARLQLYFPRSSLLPCGACVPQRHMCACEHTLLQNMAGHMDQHKQRTMPLPSFAPSIHINMNTTEGLILFLLCMEVPLVAGLKHSVKPGATQVPWSSSVVWTCIYKPLKLTVPLLVLVIGSLNYLPASHTEVR